MVGTGNPDAFIISENGDDTTWLGTCRALGRYNVKVFKLTPNIWYQSKYSQTVLSPKIYEEPEKYLHFLLKLGKKHNLHRMKSLLFPASDNSLILVSKNIEALSRYYHVVAPSWNVTQKIIDKRLTYSFAESLGVDVPRTFYPENFEDVRRISKEITYPCLLKPAFTHLFSPKYKVKLIKIQSKNNLLKIYRKLTKKKQNMMIQEEVVGPDENNYMLSTCMNKKSEPLAFITSRKIRQNPPVFGVGSFIISVWEPKVAKIGFHILKSLGFEGIANLDLKIDARTKKLKLLEVNGRVHNQISLSAFCGQNLPYTLYKDIIGIKQDPVDTSKCVFKTGVKWEHLMIDILSMIEKKRTGQISLNEWINSLYGTRCFGILSVDDPKPFLSEAKRMLLTSQSYLKNKK